MATGVDVVSPLVKDIEAALSGASGYDAARKAVDAAIAKHADDKTLASMVSLPALVSDLLGRSMAYEQVDARPVEASRVVTFAAGDGSPAFSDLSWEEAIAAFRKRGTLSESELSTLLRGYEARGEEARKLMLETIQSSVRDAIDRALTEGTSFGDFKKDIAETVIAPLGLSPADPWYLDTVLRTNVQTAYGEGRTAAQTDPVVLDAYPYWRKVVVGDGRTRPEHAALVGHVFRHGNAKTDKLRGALGFNCRCADQPVSRDYSGTITTDVPAGFAFSPGWVG